MKTFVLIALLLLYCMPTSSLAHVRGVSILKIDGENTKINPAQTSRPNVFDLPPDSDLAPQNYLINQPLEFNLDTSLFPFPPDIFEQTEFIWDFGDQTPSQTGLNKTTASHTYTQPGTYIMTIHADFSTAGYHDVGIQQIQATVLHILPDPTYQLPQPIITINNQPISESRSMDVNLNQPVEFNASASHGANLSYQWDFDDGTLSTQSTVTHQYNLPKYFATPILRITDSNGFFIDQYVHLKNNPQATTAPTRNSNATLPLTAILIPSIILLAIGYYNYRKQNQ